MGLCRLREVDSIACGIACGQREKVGYRGGLTDGHKALRSQGFTMTASSPGVTLTNGNNTSVSLSLKRIVAKIGIEINLTAVISLGTSVVTDVTISQWRYCKYRWFGCLIRLCLQL